MKNLYVDLIFKNKKSENNENDQSSDKKSEADQSERNSELIQLILDEFNLRGASNIFSKNEEVKTRNSCTKFFGTLDYPVDDQGEKGRFT